MITAEHLKKIMPHAAADFLDPLNAAMREFGIDTDLREAAFLAQAAHESEELTHLSENLNYSAASLRAVFPAHFEDTNDISSYARQPEKIANRVYANRLGNGDEASGDGWKYRGRGVFQITGKANYQECGDALGIDLVATPDLLAQPDAACRSAGWFWESRMLSPLADREDLSGITRRINGGLNGLADRMRYYRAALVALGIEQ